jgi:hypothetical protein
MALLLGQNLHAIDHVLKRSSDSDPADSLSNAVDVGVHGISRVLGGRQERFGGAVKSESSRKAVMRGALGLYGYGNVCAARELIHLLNSSGVFEKALTEVVNEHFKIEG